MSKQLKQLWTHVKALGIKHHHPATLGRRKELLNNHDWLNNITAVDLMKTLGSGMRLGAMLSRDS
jgi:tyrosyl-tRNA synthetase